MFLPFIAIAVLAVLYGLAWHNQPASRSRKAQDENKQHEALWNWLAIKRPRTPRAQHPIAATQSVPAEGNRAKPQNLGRISARPSAIHSLPPPGIRGALVVALLLGVCAAPAQDALSLSSTAPSEGLTASPFTNWNAGVTLGAGFGISAMGSREAHHLAVATVHVGKLQSSENEFLQHVELAGELWIGAQCHPETAYLVGLTPVVRYHFLPGARWTPFLDAGAGVTATDIGLPDLSTTFEFNLQAGAGLHWRWRPNTAFTFQARYLHLSNAGMDSPNSGVNTFLFNGGLTWFFESPFAQLSLPLKGRIPKP